MLRRAKYQTTVYGFGTDAIGDGAGDLLDRLSRPVDPRANVVPSR